MTPESQKKTTTKIPAKKKVAIKAKEAPAKMVPKKAVVSTREIPVKKAAKKTAVNAKKTTAKKVAVSAKETAAKQVAKKSTIISKPDRSSISISSEERWKMIAIAAYHKAERRGFTPGGELQDWEEAEKEIDELLMSGWCSS